MFTHLHGHSTFSFLEAIGRPEHIVGRVKELGMKSIAITDLGGMYGAINLFLSAKKHNIKAIIGVELGFVLDIHTISDIKKVGNICILAKSYTGYVNLMKLVSFANKDGIQGKPKIDIDALSSYHEDLIVFMGGEESWLGKMIMAGHKDEKIEEIIRLLQSTIGKENIYLELVAQNESKNDFLKKINTKVLQFAKDLEIDVIVGNVYRYIHAEDQEIREVALSIKDGKKIYDRDRRVANGDFHIMDEQEIIEILEDNGYEKSNIKQWINTNNIIAKQVDVDIKLNQVLFPNYDSPEDIQRLYEENKDQLIGE